MGRLKNREDVLNVLLFSHVQCYNNTILGEFNYTCLVFLVASPLKKGNPGDDVRWVRVIWAPFKLCPVPWPPKDGQT